MIKLIVALGKDNLIGKGNKMPWLIKNEFKHFKQTTINHSLLMGRNTFLGLPNKLNDRFIYVLSSDDIEAADQTIHNDQELDELFKKFKDSKDILFIAGGKSIYEKYYKYADELIVSRIKNDYQGDVYLDWDLSDYQLTQTIDEDQDFLVQYWTKKEVKLFDAISWDDYFMLLAKTSAFRSKDPNTQVGACIINDKKRVIALGYNGMPQGLDKIFPWDRDKEEGLNKYPYVIHAEINAILNATVSVDQGILYTSLFPCSNCAKTIVQSGIKEIVYESNKYQGTTDQKIAQFIFDQTNVKTRQHLANPRITVKLD